MHLLTIITSGVFDRFPKRRSGTGSGGGFGSRPVKHAAAPKREPIANRAAIAGVSQIGQAMGNHITEGRKILKNVPQAVFDGSRGYEPPGMISDPVKAVGVGGGRRVYASGSQGTQGAVNPGSSRARGELFPGWPAKK